MTLSRNFNPRSAALVVHMAFACAASTSAFAQVASLAPDYVMDGLWRVEDPDGHTNLRSAPSLKSKVVGQVLSGGVVFGWDPPAKDWLELEFDNGEPRYIHASRLKS